MSEGRTGGAPRARRQRARMSVRARVRSRVHALTHSPYSIARTSRLPCSIHSLLTTGPARRYANCSTTAQRGALDWWRPFRDALKPVFEKLYTSVETGEETRRTLDVNSRATYKADLEKELAELANSEMWRAGKAVRALRPENLKK